VRKFIKSDAGQIQDLACRLTGSSDLYGDDGRSAYNSVNFITCHDGFTLYDLVSYNGKHNDINLENNNDGTNDNNSWNCGWEGESTDPNVISLRKQQIKNFICLLMFSAGTSMILGGDEFMCTQHGNNNAYCQDNSLNWFDWNRVNENQDMVDFWRKTIALARKYPVLQSRKFLDGADRNGNGIPDISWFGTDGYSPRWNNSEARTLCYMLDGSEEHSPVGDYQLFIILNADYQMQGVTLPTLSGKKWFRVIYSGLAAGSDFAKEGQEVMIMPTDVYIANPRSTVVLLAKRGGCP
jgi:Type II secretory pathway, pullulanase PulA and related glycosidases